MSPVREELFAFLREDDTQGRLSAACYDSGDRAGADEICDALDILELVRDQ
jgi:hypothetical protein